MDTPVETYPCILCQENKIDDPEEVCEECRTDDGLCKCPKEDCSYRNELKSLKIHHSQSHGVDIPNLVCRFCGTVTSVKYRGRKYCNECKRDTKHLTRNDDPTEKSVCDTCDEEFTYDPRDKEGIFCSRSCHQQSMKESDSRITVECEYCGDEVKKLEYYTDGLNFCDKGCKEDHLKTEGGTDFLRPDNNPKDVGDLTEVVVKGELARYGIVTIDPDFENLRYDFLIDTGENILKVQCKHGRLKKGSVKAQTSSSYKNTTIRDAKETYEDDVDYFTIYSFDVDKTFLVPIEDIGSQETFSIRVEETNQMKNINKEEDYLLKNRDELEEWTVLD